MKLSNIIDSKKAVSIWDQAVNSEWKDDPVWVHGDFASGNILIKDNQLEAVIDFGCMAVGDPACYLVIAWTFLKEKSRQIFKDQVDLDAETWNRAKGWALWKAGFELCEIKDKKSSGAMKQLEIINKILRESQSDEFLMS